LQNNVEAIGSVENQVFAPIGQLFVVEEQESSEPDHDPDNCDEREDLFPPASKILSFSFFFTSCTMLSAQ
jgi:hypothetical protein